MFTVPDLNKKGFTLIEIAIVLLITTILIAVVVNSFSKFRNEQALKSETEEIISSLQSARDRTLSSENSYQYGVHFTSSSITIFRGASYSSSDSNNIVKNVITGTTISTISITGGGANIIFDRLTASTNTDGTIVVQATDDTTRSRTITISKTGIISGN